MDWLYHILYGFLSGLTDILPVSAPAHSVLLTSVIGEGSVSPLSRLLTHVAILGALYYASQNQFIRISRAVKLSRIPKRRRKRPLDTKSLMELQMLKTMVIPVVVGFLFYSRATALVNNLMIMAGILFLNGIILYIPQYLPGSNKDARNMSPVDAVLMGIGGAASVFPGISAVGAATSIGSIRGGEKSFCLNTALIMNMAVMLGMIFVDITGIFSTGLGIDGFFSFVLAVLSAASAFGGGMLGISLMRKLAQRSGFGIFAYYSWGAALFSFILYLTI